MTTEADTATPIWRSDLDANGKPCREGYYAHDGRGLVLMPPTAGMAKGLRLATADEVAAGKYRPANVEDCE